MAIDLRNKRAGALQLLLWLIVLLLVVVLVSCAAESNGKGADSTDRGASGTETVYNGPTQRLLLGGTSVQDSVAVIGDIHVDQIMRQILDSIPQAEYLTLNYRDSLALADDQNGIELEKLFERLDLDGIFYVDVARFGSILGLQLRMVDRTGTTRFRELAFDVIRYRDSTGTMLIGPTLYDAVRTTLGRYLQLPHAPNWPVATEVLVPTGIVMPAGPDLGRLGADRADISKTALRALAEYANRHFPELIAFDPASRDLMYKAAELGNVENYKALNDLERGTLYRVGIDRYVTGSVTPVAGDSLHVRLELRQLRSRTNDVLVDSADTTLPRITFETTTAKDDFVIMLIDMAEGIYLRESERVREGYQNSIKDQR